MGEWGEREESFLHSLLGSLMIGGGYYKVGGKLEYRR